MHFIHSALTWAFLLVLVPPLIHLINLMRHQKVPWAAMEFLLESYRKHSNWIRLRQLLLLLARMAAIALVVAVLGKLVTPDQWSSLWGTHVTHHYVLVDDSYSMADRTDAMRIFDRGLQVVRGLARMAATRPNRQIVSVLTFSQAAAAMKAEETLAATRKEPADDTDNEEDRPVKVAPTVLQAEVTGNTDVDAWLDEVRGETTVTELHGGPLPALRIVQRLIEQSPAENHLVYVVSDFRSQQWSHPNELIDSLKAIESSAAEVNLVRCVEQSRSNLAITDLRVLEGTRAAGIPITAQLRVTNHSERDVFDIPLQVQTKFFDPEEEQTADPTSVQPITELLAVEPLEVIPAGQSAVRQFQFYFPHPGQHVLEASLPEDSVPTDNQRYHVVHLPENVHVLLLDGGPERRAASFVSAVFTPGTRTRTGIQPHIEAPVYLRDHGPDALRQFDTIYLMNVSQLDERSVEHLETFVEDGGNLCMFMGPQIQLQFYNSWFSQGTGLFPVRLERRDMLVPDVDQQTPDFVVDNHPVFRVFHGQRNPFLSGVTVEQYFRTTDGWQPDVQSTTRVLARLRNGQPLCIERTFGTGRVVTFLTTVTPDWNNWARDPSFVVVLLDLQSYLGAERAQDTPRLVGSPLDVHLDAARYRSDLSFMIPDPVSPSHRPVDVQAVHDPQQPEFLRASLGRSFPGQRDKAVDHGGVYEAWAVTRDGDIDVSRFALNVDPLEGNLQVASPEALSSHIAGTNIRLRLWNEFEIDQVAQAGFHWTNLLLGCLVLLLLIEQALGYWCSYHVNARRQPL